MKKNYLFKMFLMAFVLMLLGGVNASAVTVTSTFTNKDWSVGTGEHAWTSSNNEGSYDSQYGRGVSFGKNKGTLTLSSNESFTSVTQVVVVASANGTEGYLSVKIGETTIGSNKNIQSGTENKNKEYKFSSDSKLDGIITITATEGNHSIWIKSISVTYETSSTPTKTTAVIFDFTANPWGITPTTGNGNNKSNTDERTDLVVDGVKLTTTSSTSADYNYKTCIYKSSSGIIDLRVYKGGTLTFTAPEDYTISKIVFTGTVGLESKVGTFDSNVWTTTDGVNSVVFTRSATTYIQTAAITLVRSVENKTMVATDKEAYYSTFSCDRAVVFTEDVNVYAVNVTDGKLKLTALTKGDYKTTNSTTETVTNGYYVPANTGVLIKATKQDIKYYTAATDQTHANIPANNQLVAATTNGKFEGVTGYKYYKLAYDDYEKETGLGFYYGAAGGTAFVVKKGLAYLAVPVNGSKPAAGYAFGGNGGDDTTGINGIENDNVNETQTIYNLQGQRVEKAGLRGIYIVNGKKVVLK